MRKFDTKVQYLKYKVLREVARAAFNDKLLETVNDIPKKIVSGKEPTMRCCVYKERAILSERVKLAMGGDSSNPNVIEVIDIACDECPMGGYEVTNACRGCIAHRCEEVCRKGAITFDRNQKAHIDKTKCVECGMCAKVCPYSAIAKFKRPYEYACKVGAISMNDDKSAKISNDKCIACGACVYQCPFGAIMDKSYILNVIDMIKKSDNNTKFRLYAVVAPSISSQFTYAKLGQVITGIKKLGFFSVVEAALGADMVADSEARELEEKGFLTSSCCPAFVDYIHKKFPDMVKHISHNLSPMATIAKYIKETTPDAKIVFIGPCTAKKMEFKKPEVHPWIDSVLTFEELQGCKFIQSTKDYFSIEHHLHSISLGMTKAGSFHNVVTTNSDNLLIEMLLYTDICNFSINLLKDAYRIQAIRALRIEDAGKCLSLGCIRRRKQQLGSEYQRLLKLLCTQLFGKREPGD